MPERRPDLLIIILAILLLIAMALTLLYGGERSLHGYGNLAPPFSPQQGQLLNLQLRTHNSKPCSRPALQDRQPLLGPCIYSAGKVVHLVIPLPHQVTGHLGAA